MNSKKLSFDAYTIVTWELPVSDMAARVSTSVVDFGLLAKKIPDVQKNAFAALRAKVEGHLRNTNANPATLPAIDFAAYSKVNKTSSYTSLVSLFLNFNLTAIL